MVFYTAVRAYFEGDLGLVFDGERLTGKINQQYADWLFAPIDFHPWLYPPHFLLLLLPFGMLSFATSYIIFMSLTFTALVYAVSRLTGRLFLTTISLLIFPQSPFAFFTGQNNFLTGSILVGGFALTESSPLLGGALLGIGTYKPQLFLMVPVALIASRQWKVLVSTSATVVTLSLTSLVLFGWGIWNDWLRLMLAPSDTYQSWLAAGRLVGQSVYTCAVLVGASISVANTAQAIAALLGGGCVYWVFSRQVPTDLRLAVLLAAALLASPHVSSQDGVLLAVGAIFLFCRIIDGEVRLIEPITIVAIWLAELFDPPKFFRLGVITPVILCVFIAVVMARAKCLLNDTERAAKPIHEPSSAARSGE
jgi:hypothetical protein